MYHIPHASWETNQLTLSEYDSSNLTSPTLPALGNSTLIWTQWLECAIPALGDALVAFSPTKLRYSTQTGPYWPWTRRLRWRRRGFLGLHPMGTKSRVASLYEMGVRDEARAGKCVTHWLRRQSHAARSHPRCKRILQLPRVDASRRVLHRLGDSARLVVDRSLAAIYNALIVRPIQISLIVSLTQRWRQSIPLLLDLEAAFLLRWNTQIWGLVLGYVAVIAPLIAVSKSVMVTPGGGAPALSRAASTCSISQSKPSRLSLLIKPKAQLKALPRWSRATTWKKARFLLLVL